MYVMEKKMATHSSILAWTIPWREEPGEATDHGLQKSWTWLSDSTIDTWRANAFWQTHKYLLFLSILALFFKVKYWLENQMILIFNRSHYYSKNIQIKEPNSCIALSQSVKWYMALGIITAYFRKRNFFFLNVFG